MAACLLFPPPAERRAISRRKSRAPCLPSAGLGRGRCWQAVTRRVSRRSRRWSKEWRPSRRCGRRMRTFRRGWRAVRCRSGGLKQWHRGGCRARVLCDCPLEIWVGAPGKWTQVTHVNDGVRAVTGKGVSLRWKSESFNVQGFLIYPVNFNPSQKYPMIVQVHGGPSSSVNAGTFILPDALLRHGRTRAVAISSSSPTLAGATVRARHSRVLM